MLVGQT